MPSVRRLEPTMKKQSIQNIADLDRLEAAVSASASLAMRSLAGLSGYAPIDALAAAKFSQIGRDPLDPNRPLNLIEQINQTFTYLASITGARWLLRQHPECVPLTLNLGTQSGFDIESNCGHFVAETFAATDPKSNDKLRKDLAKLGTSKAPHRFLFYLSPITDRRPHDEGISVVPLVHPVMARFRSVQSDA
jgi:hypothetical protein